MKKGLLILLCLPMIGFGQATSSCLDKELYGVWEASNAPDIKKIYRSFSSNGKCGYWEIYNNSQKPVNTSTGDWWVEDDYIHISNISKGLNSNKEFKSGSSLIMRYKLPERNRLTLNNGNTGNWIKK